MTMSQLALDLDEPTPQQLPLLTLPPPAPRLAADAVREALRTRQPLAPAHVALLTRLSDLALDDIDRARLFGELVLRVYRVSPYALLELRAAHVAVAGALSWALPTATESDPNLRTTCFFLHGALHSLVDDRLARRLILLGEMLQHCQVRLRSGPAAEQTAVRAAYEAVRALQQGRALVAEGVLHEPGYTSYAELACVAAARVFQQAHKVRPQQTAERAAETVDAALLTAFLVELPLTSPAVKR